LESKLQTIKPYKSWDYCKSVNCRIYVQISQERRKEFCVACHAYQMHQYLKNNGQIIDESEA
jgi:hypothetical protein